MKKVISRTKLAKVANRDCNCACSAKVSKRARVTSREKRTDSIDKK